MARKPGRTQLCTAADARARREHARKFLEVAELVALEEPDNPESCNVAASLAVLAGIAACDAACCDALEGSRGQDHRDAEALVAQIEPDGETASRQLRRLLNVKDTAQYGFINLGGAELRGVMRQAAHLLSFAEQVRGR
ncbi:hypothetical protein Q5424_16410 [Conexibacter sp. JD483]|uniref:hypothetical protein n=1 Tax=unclassified Conexibacter TaxID=2627773 RepID=UPI002727AAB4|nr:MULTISPECIES: hypothetical protein [unclassified Conexibacter]MDO8188395.1 hypothetical protein [Conexibacter sp. CPCC 205706]MDO8198182.1 hypothetical protein [Conexibacter sp. CPCC 205762]MDR9370682.1 hypothetical protein [Conexibacter sp. JD483]